MFDLLSLHRRAYNLSIEHFKTTTYKEQKTLTTLRKCIKENVKCEWEDRLYRAEVVGEAVISAFKTRSAIIATRKKGLECDYSFKSIKETNQYFIEQRLNRTFMERFHVTEKIKENAWGKTTNIIFESGRWFVCTIDQREIAGGAESQGLRLCSIDPGVRTFATVYSNKDCYKIGDDFYKDKVFPILLKLDKLFSKRTIYLNTKPLREAQAFGDNMRYFSKKINKLRNRMDDLVADLHRRTAHWLVISYDVILLPTFETKNMVKKQKRKLRTKTVRSMLGLRHYQFQMMMKWMCKKYGKTLIMVNEAYTSKTQSWNGEIVHNLGGSKTIGKDIKVVNGARGIMLRALSVASTENRNNQVVSIVAI